MAASSPSLSNNSFSSVVTPHKTQRGLNKPNCIQCGNVARSRCPFQSCKGCCSTAENPCPIHVLKVATTSAEKTQAPSTPSSEQKATEGTPGMARKRAETATEPSKEIKARGKLSRANKCMKTTTKKLQESGKHNSGRKEKSPFKCSAASPSSQAQEMPVLDLHLFRVSRRCSVCS